MNNSPYYSLEIMAKTSQLIAGQFNVTADYAQRLAIGALNGIVSHGGDATDWECIDNTVRVVVKSWIENGIDFPDAG